MTSWRSCRDGHVVDGAVEPCTRLVNSKYLFQSSHLLGRVGRSKCKFAIGILTSTCRRVERNRDTVGWNKPLRKQGIGYGWDALGTLHSSYNNDERRAGNRKEGEFFYTCGKVDWPNSEKLKFR